MNKTRGILLGLILLVLAGSFFAYQINVSAEPAVPAQVLTVEQQAVVDDIYANPGSYLAVANGVNAPSATASVTCSVYGDLSQPGLVLAAHVGALRVFNNLSGGTVTKVAECGIGSFMVSFAQDVNFVYAVDSDKIYKISVADFTIVDEFTAQPNESFDKVIYANGKLIAVFLDSNVSQGRLMAINPNNMERLWTSPAGVYVQDIVEAGNTIAAVYPTSVMKINPENGNVIASYPVNFPAMRLDVRGNVVFVVGGYRSILMNIDNGSVFQYVDHSHIPVSATIGWSQIPGLPVTPEYLMGTDSGSVVFGPNLGSSKVCANGGRSNNNAFIGDGRYLNSSNIGTSILTTETCNFGPYGYGEGNPGMEAQPLKNQFIYLPVAVSNQ